MALAAQGLTLRVREVDGHFIQTVKSRPVEGGGAGAALVRGEWEDAVAGPLPDPQAAQTARFLSAEIAERVRPVFRSEIGRTTIELTPDADTRVEAAIDRGRIVAIERRGSEPVSEIELELKSGSPAALYDLALDLLAVAPLRLERRSKSERGYRLAAGSEAAAEAVHAEPIELGPGLTGDEALRRIGLGCLEQILRNEPAVAAGDPEGIHQMRVGVRRLRAILSAFGKMLPDEQRRWASAELHWLADALGAARNLDVFEQELIAPAREALDHADGLDALTNAAERRRQTAYAAARRALRTTRHTSLMLRLLRWFDGCGWRHSGAADDLGQPIDALAARVLDRCRQTAQRRSRGFAEQSAEQRHRLRIALKKLRYATEVLGDLYQPDEAEQFTKRLKRLQDDLGEANDLRVAHDLVTSLAKPHGGGRGAIAQAGKCMLVWHEDRLAKREPRMHQHLDRLLETEPFWAR